MKNESKALRRLNEEYLMQEGIEVTDDNIEIYGVDDSRAEVIYEDEDLWMILSPEYRVINFVYKDKDTRMKGSDY